MDVVRHQYVGMHLHAVLSRGSDQAIQVFPEILLASKACLSIIATLNEVLGDASQKKATGIGHGPIVSECARIRRQPTSPAFLGN